MILWFEYLGLVFIINWGYMFDSMFWNVWIKKVKCMNSYNVVRFYYVWLSGWCDGL